MRSHTDKYMSIIFLLFVFVLLSRNSCASEKNYGFFPVINIKASYPQTASFELGTVYLYGERGENTHSGPFLSYEPGINGQKIHLGFGILAYKGSVFEGVMVGGRISASYYKPWRDTNGLSNDDNYFGAEILGYYGIIVVSGGVYYGIEREKLLGTVGVGIGW